MKVLTDADWLNQQYLSKFGRTADTTSAGGAKYWLDQMTANPTSHTRDEVARMLGASAEGQSYANDQVVRPGGVDRGASTVSQADNEYLKSISNLGLNNANVLNTIAGNSFLAGTDGNATTDNVAGGYFQASDKDIIDGGDGGNNGGDGGNNDDGTTNNYLTSDDLTSWWDALDKSSFTGSQSGGMDDFMKFMMLMSVMGGKGGQGGYGGSQYGYGGLNPGGVMQAYDPMAQLQGMGTWFKDNFGSGGATTSTVNTGTAGN